MCIIFFIAHEKPTDNSPYKLILASNRDEVYSRPTQSAEVWSHAKFVIGGESPMLIKSQFTKYVS